MTKFEKEFKALTSWDWVNVDLIQKILTKFGNWHSDEEFQDMKAIGGSFALANQNLIDDNKKLVKEISDLKSQLQQQALPVVPDFIGKLINTFGAPEDGKHINYSASYLEIQKELDWIDNHQKTWLTALLIGFRVEKPQLFYLRDELTGQFLAKDNRFKDKDRYFFWTGEDPLTHSIGTAWKLSFTQQEIDSMQTGSYELVPVEEGK
ncbi:DUF1642 domain-containing protein [Lactococcus lactis]|uniref:DUF1642 domain-containing protein n=1 Tax=Lactococcus lactis TaxID=1358 RepID=UPI000F5299F3|nr:DUF1642 domain-containing protein [Lactococcus lactis]RQE00513.1 DUF1642 domain-containing protein [Lactococcus lactis]RQE04531.1 DUF1642 domain-containing protein [Lactococcus lactis]RQE07342.1 DUF1642 domain-containing protein [Lactococcus lactis]RQE11120.1 DUF1642 domain-containing protein [Lactococcus lactis]RQE13167.1 DUF1642 domain-containing protein [Lactococcus lactis]